MKGFIEVTTKKGNDKCYVNIKNIEIVSENLIKVANNYIYIIESYEEIKELIKNAQ